MIYLHLAGGLGNQMFQYAAALALQQMQQDEIAIDLADMGTAKFSLNHFDISNDVAIVNSRENSIAPVRHFLKKCINALIYRVGKYCGWGKSCSFISLFTRVWQKMGFYFCPTRYKRLTSAWSKNKVMQGYFQSYRYFNHIRETILSNFRIITPPTPSNASLLQVIAKQEAVCVHIRRGDYVTFADIHLVCDEKYYLEGMRVIANNTTGPVFYIFSDDIEWCKTNIAFEHEVTFVEGNNPDYEELRLMSACKHFVISNSSFSWWAQYLSQHPNKVVVAPSKWFNDDIQMDIWMPEWHILKINEMGT